MRIEVRYYTRSGNTEKLAKSIAQAIGVVAEPITVTLDEKTDVLFLGCSYYAFDMDPSVKTFITENKEKIGKLVCFGTSAAMKSMKKPMLKVTEPHGILLAEEEFHCRGAFGPMHKKHPDANDLEKAAEFAKRVVAL